MEINKLKKDQEDLKIKKLFLFENANKMDKKFLATKKKERWFKLVLLEMKGHTQPYRNKSILRIYYE